VTVAIDRATTGSGARQLTASPAFEWAMVALSTAVAGGAHVDAWAHGHVPSTLETFFTPWHAVLYASLLATTAFLVLSAASTGARPWEWGRALPDGYALSLVGCLLFAVAGVLDLAWHLRFGIEAGFEALISPTHLFLMVSAGLIVSGPLRAAWRCPGRRLGWPAVASAMLTLTGLTFFAQFDHPFTQPWASLPGTSLQAHVAEELGMLGVILQTGLLMGVALLLVRRFDLPPGTFTVVMGVNAVFVTLIREAGPVILVGVAAGLAADVLHALLRPSPARLERVRLFAFAVPLVLYGLYFGGVLVTSGSWWPVHLWAGAPVVAGLTGWIVSLAVLPPAVPER
jgi:hypothetical protein